MHDEEEKNDDIHEGEPVDLDDAFEDDGADLNDEGMESLEEHFEDYEDDEDSSLDERDGEY